jgi:hypothetical protein
MLNSPVLLPNDWIMLFQINRVDNYLWPVQVADANILQHFEAVQFF